MWFSKAAAGAPCQGQGGNADSLVPLIRVTVQASVPLEQFDAHLGTRCHGDCGELTSFFCLQTLSVENYVHIYCMCYCICLLQRWCSFTLSSLQNNVLH